MIEATSGAPGAGCCAERSKLDRVASKRVADTKTGRGVPASRDRGALAEGCLHYISGFGIPFDYRSLRLCSTLPLCKTYLLST